MGGAVIGDFNAPKFGTKRGETRLGAGLTADHGGYSSSKKTVAGVRIAAGAAPAGLNLSNPRPPIWQTHSAGQQSAATQKIADSFLRILRFLRL
jgi:hypothetical protein